eukprot:scaffold9073_cov180-Skeletonema_dohrnii-CCMP3373.AAC.4
MSRTLAQANIHFSFITILIGPGFIRPQRHDEATSPKANAFFLNLGYLPFPNPSVRACLSNVASGLTHRAGVRSSGWLCSTVERVQ